THVLPLSLRSTCLPMKSIKIKRTHFFKIAAGILPALLPACGLPAGAAPNPPSGKIVIPARSLYSLQEGTVEAWVKLDFDPTGPVAGYTARGGLFHLVVPEAHNDRGAQMSVFFASTGSYRKGERDRS